jgi:hypothetical protein
MRSLELLVIANEDQAHEIIRSFSCSTGPSERWPTVSLGDIDEEELAYLGANLGVCDDADRDAVAGALLCGEPPKPFVCRVLTAFIDALAGLNAADIRRVAEEWCDADFRTPGGSKRFLILVNMVELARQAKIAGKPILLACPGYQ